MKLYNFIINGCAIIVYAGNYEQAEIKSKLFN
jgi:hypothetical protein